MTCMDALMLRRQEPRAAQATSVWLWRKDSNLNLSVNSRVHRPAMLRQNKTGAEGEREIYSVHPCASGLWPSTRLFKFVPDEFVNSQLSDLKSDAFTNGLGRSTSSA